MTKFFHRTDPGHGWVSVPRKLIDQLGIAEDITPYSYQKGGTVYLEEDVDASTFAEAAEAAGIEVEFVTTYAYTTPIRGYAPYTVVAPPTPADIRAIEPGDKILLRPGLTISGWLDVTRVHHTGRTGTGRAVIAGGYRIRATYIAQIEKAS